MARHGLEHRGACRPASHCLCCSALALGGAAAAASSTAAAAGPPQQLASATAAVWIATSRADVASALHRQAGKALPLITTTNPAGTSRGSHCCGSSSHGSTRSTRSRGSVCRSSGADMPNVSRQPPQRQCKLRGPRRLPASSRAAMCRLPGSQRWACPADSPCRMLWRHVHLTALVCCTNTLKSNLPCCRIVLPERQPSGNGCANRMPRQGGLPGSVHCRRSSSRR